MRDTEKPRVGSFSNARAEQRNTLGTGALSPSGRLTGHTEVDRLCTAFAVTPYPLLILGEPGVGKTRLARQIHELSGRTGPFVTCSMVGIPPNLEHAHLSGHAKGAFTGALEHRTGHIEAAHRGTLFLDELGLASVTAQQILLQLLDDGTLSRIGEVRPRPVDVRFVAATNADLPTMAEAGTFRRDLLGRFGYLSLRLPPLRSRRREILGFVERYLRAECQTLGRGTTPTLSAELRACLETADWPDNVRQVRSVCRYFAVTWDGDAVLNVDDLPPDFPFERDAWTPKGPHRAEQMVARHGGNKAAAARAMGISRRHLYRLLK